MRGSVGSGCGDTRAANARTLLGHELGQSDGAVEWRAGQEPVPEVEDVTGASPRALEDVERLRVDHVVRGEQRDRVEVALDRQMMPDTSPSLVEGHAPVEANDCGAVRPHVL